MLGSASALETKERLFLPEISPGFPVREENWHVAEAAFEKLIRRNSEVLSGWSLSLEGRLIELKLFRVGSALKLSHDRSTILETVSCPEWGGGGFMASMLSTHHPANQSSSLAYTHTPSPSPESPRGSPWLLTWAGEPASTTPERSSMCSAAGAMVTNIMKIASWLTDKRDSTGAAAVFFYRWIIEKEKKRKKCRHRSAGGYWQWR